MNHLEESTVRLSFFWALPLAFLSATSAWGDEIKIVTGGTCFNQVFKKISAEYEKLGHDKIVLIGDPNTNSTEKIFKLVDSGEAEAGCTAGNWRDVPEVLKKAKLEIKGIGQYQPQVIGADRLQVYLNKENRLSKLSDVQLKMIFSGKLKNWKDIAGPDAPVELVYSPSQGALLFFFEKKILNGNKLAPAAASPENMAQVIPSVAKSIGAVGLTSYGYGNDSVKSVEHDEIGRPLNLFTKTKPSEALRKLLVWLNNDGRKIIYK